jgi:hypothetical protein
MDKKLADMLWTARWGIKNKKMRTAKEAIDDALVHIGAEKKKTSRAQEPDRPSNPMPVDFMKGIEEPEFVVVKGVRFKDRGNYRTKTGMFEGLTLHYAVSGNEPRNARGVVRWLAKQGYAAPAMDKNGVIYIPEGYDIFRDWGYHAGKSKRKGKSGVSKYDLGLEVCCWGRNSKVGPYRTSKGEANIIAGKYQKFTAKQEKAIVNLIMWLKSQNPEFNLDNVYGHDELRTNVGRKGDKQDPGASLSMTMPKYRTYIKKQWAKLNK